MPVTFDGVYIRLRRAAEQKAAVASAGARRHGTRLHDGDLRPSPRQPEGRRRASDASTDDGYVGFGCSLQLARARGFAYHLVTFGLPVLDASHCHNSRFLYHQPLTNAAYENLYQHSTSGPSIALPGWDIRDIAGIISTRIVARDMDHLIN